MTFKNYVSLLVSKNRSQKLIKLFVPEQQSPPAFVYAPLDWCHYGYGYITSGPGSNGNEGVPQILQILTVESHH